VSPGLFTTCNGTKRIQDSASGADRGQLKCDSTRAETRFRLSAKRTSPFKSAGGASVQSTTGSRGVRISGSNAGYTMFRGSVKSTGYPLCQFPLHFPSRASPCATTFQLESTNSPVTTCSLLCTACSYSQLDTHTFAIGLPTETHSMQ